MSVENSSDIIMEALKALANKVQAKIVNALSREEKSVGQLAAITGLSQSAVSQHLGRLRNADLVKTRREAQTIYYALNAETIEPVFDYFSQLKKELYHET